MISSSGPEKDDAHSDIKQVAGGAGLAFLGRLGALIEAVSVVVFTWAYGAETFGLFAVLWSYVKVTTALSDAAMTTSLQRFVPRVPKEQEAQVAGFALKLSFLIAVLFAGLGTYYAPALSAFINVGPTDQQHLTDVIRVYVWVLPFWTAVEVGTAAIRARRKFGPEIRVRIFYEQGLRLVAAVVFFYFGLNTYGLFLAHLLSVVLAAILALRLISKHYDLRAVLAAPMTGKIPQDMRKYGFSVMPSNLIKKLFSEFPVMMLNFVLPGGAGAAAGGYYSVARKLASALQVVRLAFEYVMAPLAAEKDGKGDKHRLEHMYAFATRMSVCLALPFGAALYLARGDILSALEPEFQAAAMAIAVLVAGRVLEAASGPSQSIVEMLGHRFLPPVNGLIGLSIFIWMGFSLIPLHGVTGAAIAAATGLNITAYLAFFQSGFLFKLFPYNRDFLKPVAISLISALILIALAEAGPRLPAPSGLIAAIVGLIVALLVLVRYGLKEDDTAALGKLGKWLGRKPA
ncbi:MAG: lipopolysaccharide biosynthesis protein [Kordiimonadaceae bacterium]|nr:lipopolysaccharide biosynthesis protein [Kordiimonadaceae bacterium]MBO6570531.1 lipopolysaccharide biosynthesis protein [Kordiimonadaceae bacterium]MBO6966350.1 lipopolysaccharide biosynthesis protein [Kordiimonadaceae bacterium]